MSGADPRSAGRPGGGAPSTKSELRRLALRRRAELPVTARQAAGQAIAGHVATLVERSAARTVAAYVAVGTEPETLPALRKLRAAGVTVLLPVLDGPGLDWAPFAGEESLAPATRGLVEPTTPRQGPAALAGADLVLAPALLVDRSGHRLGRGAGFYDRALAGLASRVLAVVYDDEVVPALPVEPHDVPVTGALRPAGVLLLGR